MFPLKDRKHLQTKNKLDYSHRQRLTMFLKKIENTVLFYVLFERQKTCTNKKTLKVEKERLLKGH